MIQRHQILKILMDNESEVDNFNDAVFSDKYGKVADAIETLVKESDSLPCVSDCFYFAKYLNENFHYFDNTDVGDVYKDNDGQGLYSEKDIYDEWLNNR